MGAAEVSEVVDTGHAEREFTGPFEDLGPDVGKEGF